VEITFEGRTYPCSEGETVLDALLRGGVEHPFSCKVGTCLTCLARAAKGDLTARAQKGLKPTLVTQGYFLPCVCEPKGPLQVAGAEDADLFGRAVVTRKEMAAPDVARIWLRPAMPLYYRAGQFVNLRRADGLQRSYSVASVPQLDEDLELHVKSMPRGRMSTWICDELQVGEALDVQGPNGDCFYLPGSPDQPLLLVGTGTGLAPMIGVARDALMSKHSGPIRLYHGALDPPGFYLEAELRALAGEHSSVEVHFCLSGDEEAERQATEKPKENYRIGFSNDLALADQPGLKGWRVYLCGHPAMVKAAKKASYLAGAEMADILADPFDFQELRTELRDEPEPLNVW